jgi:hypothetical protein
MMTVAEKLKKIADNEPRVFEAGKSKGYTEGLNKGGYADGYEQGKKAEYDAFWDAFQQNGDRNNYGYTFFGSGWTDETFKPKYNIVPNTAYLIFQSSKISEKAFKDAMDRGIVFDFSKAQRMQFGFAEMVNLKEIPFDVSLEGIEDSSTYGGSIFSYNPNLETIKKIILRADGTTLYKSSLFDYSPKIKNVQFEGVLGESLAMGHCKQLSADSIRSIIEHLSDTAEGKTLTLSQVAVDNADFGGGDTVYMSTDDPFGSYLLSNPIPLSKGQRIKIDAEWEDGHGFYDDTSSVAWWFDSTGDTTGDDNATGTPGQTLPRFYTATSDKQVVYGWYFYSNSDVSNIPIKIRAVLVDEDGNELTGENLHSFVSNTVTNGNGTTLTIAEESWETLAASKPNWTITLV